MAHARDALWESGHDETVEVNQRALIDKVLARYSGEFTVFRELLQNSDDAGARAVEIHFETKDFLESKNEDAATEVSEDKTLARDQRRSLDKKAALVHQWTFKNNGMIFRDEDWSRLKKIAEGNPDEEKIGAFGVGFYSLFSVTEEPFVTSGGQWMAFYWKDKKDQLFARRGVLPPKEPSDPWTTFEMSLREPAPIPRAFDFTRFLASSITFMAHLLEVSVYLDDKRISRLTKEPGLSKSINIPSGLKRSSPLGIMQIKDVQTTPLSIKAELMQWVYMAGTENPPPKVVAKPSSAGAGGFFSSLFSSFAGGTALQRSVTPAPVADVTEDIDPTTINEMSVVLSTFSADIGVQLDNKIRSELDRATKKNSPTKMSYALIYTGKDEYDASKKEDEKQPEMTGSVFQGLRADLDGAGSAKIFIGHATGQTTGLGGHMSARFIPTVERESIDLVDRNVAVWNKELLYVGGFLARAAYELEMENVDHLWKGAAQSTSTTGRDSDASPDVELQTWLRGRSIHALKFFTFHPSTPSSSVSSLMEEAFFSCIISSPFPMFSTPHSFPIISTVGVRSASDVRIPDPAFSGFLKNLPVLPEEVSKEAKTMVDTLRRHGQIQDITFVDVLQELRSRPLSETEMTACFKWWVQVQNQGNLDIGRIRTELLNAAILTVGGQGTPDEKIIPLSSVRTFLNTRSLGALIPTDGPLPPHLLPVSISRHFDPQALASTFPWKELNVLDWLTYIAGPAGSSLGVEFDITHSPPWAERVLNVLSRAWQSLSKGSQEQVVVMLKDKACVPTSSGMKTPQETYFQSAHIFRDLPIVLLPSGVPVKAPMEKVLQAIGVRKHVDLQIVFDRMIKTGDWSIAELTKYLVAVQSTLNPVELERLRMTAAFPKEADPREGDSDRKVSRYKASDLYEPLDVFRELGLPVVDWGTHTKWRANSEEAKLLFRLGLRRFPPLATVLDLAANPKEGVRSAALKYFLDNFNTRYAEYDHAAFAELAYIPAMNGNSSCMAKTREVFGSSSWSPLGFMVVDPSLKGDALSKLQVQEHPPTPMLVSLLQRTPPRNEAVARQWFAILASRISDFSTAELKTLSQLPFVPNQKGSDSAMRLLPPSQCFLSGESNAQFHSKLFVFVDFGPQGNRFLSACGTKQEPSVEEIAQILLGNPRQFYQLAEGRDNFLVELRNIAVNRRSISSGTFARLKKAAILLGSRRVTREKSGTMQTDGTGELEEDDWDFEYDLLTPDKVVVVADDTNAYQLFGATIFTAPQEDLLEEFYLELGSRRLSSLLKEEYRTSGELKNSRRALEIRSLILERLPLFLHEHTHARPRLPFSWLNNEKNFVVRTFSKLVVIKSLTFGSVHPSKSQDASAVAKRDGRGPIELWVAGNDQVDMYEVAISMCRLLFDSPKANDGLLLMTILSTDLRALRRRGYNVDKILRQQKAAHAAAEEANREKQRSTALITQPSFPSISQPPSVTSYTEKPSSKADGRPASAIRDSLDNFRRKLIRNSLDATTPPVSERPVARPPGVYDMAGSMANFPTSMPGQMDSPRRRTPQAAVTPRSNISSNIEMAINACRGESSQHLQNNQQMTRVKESLNEGYCDVSGHAADMSLVGEMGKFLVFVSQGVPDPKSIMSTKANILARFIYVIRPLSEVYKLPISSVHIFYDSGGELIAFNRNASLFLNLRYFEAWHDQDVQKGELSDAYISWYFTLAHEIAHNLVRPHNSEHEFYFSSICEAYLPSLAKLLSEPSA
ncbi:hypothetical protein BKA93DRAFT_925530 [Sparassis latifolia]